MKILVKLLKILGAFLSIVFLLLFFIEGMISISESDISTALIEFVFAIVSMIIFIACVSRKKNNKSSSIPYEMEPIDGYRLAYHYDDVDVCCINAVPREAMLNNKLCFVQETTNLHDPKAVAIILIPQRKKLGYLYRGRLQDMANDYIRRGDQIKARITYINHFTREVSMSLSFFKKIK